MNKEFSAGAIIFRRDNNNVLFLLIYSNRNKIWGFPKGHMEPGEDEKETALREIEEETGLKDLKMINGFREEDIYDTISKRFPFKGQLIEKHAIYFLCETESQDIIVDGHEISDYKFLSISEAEGLLKFEGLKRILKKADDFLSKV